jgi:hypothetical protein
MSRLHAFTKGLRVFCEFGKNRVFMWFLVVFVLFLAKMAIKIILDT